LHIFQEYFPNLLTKRTYIRGGGTYTIFSCTFSYKVCRLGMGLGWLQVVI
jgi:hypothetical protein